MAKSQKEYTEMKDNI